MTELMAFLQRELDELNYAIKLREGYVANMYERRAELERRIAELEAARHNGGDWSF
jgi:prefoldin subunit 5